MRVLKNNYNNEYAEEVKRLEPYPRKHICEYCGSELEYEEDDLRIGAWGFAWLDCPLCEEGNVLEENENSITLTVDNIEFPIHFHHCSVETGAVDIAERDFKKYLKEAINYFRMHKDEFDWGGHITGNLYLHVHRFEDDECYEVVVSKDFYSIDIPFEKLDYKIR